MPVFVNEPAPLRLPWNVVLALLPPTVNETAPPELFVSAKSRPRGKVLSPFKPPNEAAVTEEPNTRVPMSVEFRSTVLPANALPLASTSVPATIRVVPLNVLAVPNVSVPLHPCSVRWCQQWRRTPIW